MRHFLTMLIAFHWMAVFAILAAVSTLNPEHGILAALRFLGAVPLPDARFSGGGPAVAGFLSFAFAVASLLFLWTLLTACGETACSAGKRKRWRAALSVPASAVFSLLLIGGALLPVSGLFLTSAVAVTALLASYLAILRNAGRRRFRRRTIPTFAPRFASWPRVPRTAPCSPGFPAGRTQPARHAHEVHFRVLGSAAAGVLGLVLPVAQRHEFRLHHADAPGARAGIPTVRRYPRRRPGIDPGNGRAGLHLRHGFDRGDLGIPPPARARGLGQGRLALSGSRSGHLVRCRRRWLRSRAKSEQP